MTWLIIIWIAFGLYEWSKMFRESHWIGFIHIGSVVLFVMLGPIVTFSRWLDEWIESKK